MRPGAGPACGPCSCISRLTILQQAHRAERDTCLNNSLADTGGVTVSCVRNSWCRWRVVVRELCIPSLDEPELFTDPGNMQRWPLCQQAGAYVCACMWLVGGGSVSEQAFFVAMCLLVLRGKTESHSHSTKLLRQQLTRGNF